MFLITSAVQDVVPPISLTSARLVFGSFFLLLALLFDLSSLQEVRTFCKRDWITLFCIGSTNTVLPYILFASALGTGVNVGTASALAGAIPIVAACFCGFWECSFGRRYNRLTPASFNVLGLTVGFVGVVLVAFGKTLHTAHSQNSWMGLLLQFTAVASKAFAAVLSQYWNAQTELSTPPLVQAFIQATFGAMLAVVLVFCTDYCGTTPDFLDPRHLTRGGRFLFLSHVGFTQFLSLLCLGCFGSCLVYVLQFFLVKHVGAVRQTLMDQLSLIVGVFEGAVFRGDWDGSLIQQQLLFYVGALLIMTGASLVYMCPDGIRRSSDHCQVSLGDPLY